MVTFHDIGDAPPGRHWQTRACRTHRLTPSVQADRLERSATFDRTSSRGVGMRPGTILDHEAWASEALGDECTPAVGDLVVIPISTIACRCINDMEPAARPDTRQPGGDRGRHHVLRRSPD